MSQQNLQTRSVVIHHFIADAVTTRRLIAVQVLELLFGDFGLGLRGLHAVEEAKISPASRHTLEGVETWAEAPEMQSKNASAAHSTL